MIDLGWDMLAKMSNDELKEFVNKPKAEREAELNRRSKTEAEILTERITDRVTNIKNDVEVTLLAVEEINKLKISCPKCHGKGVYDVQVEYPEKEVWGYEPRLCRICGGVGKVTVEAYEEYQERCRND